MSKKAKPKTPDVKKLSKDEPVKTDLSFEQLIKLTVNTPIKGSKIPKI